MRRRPRAARPREGFRRSGPGFTVWDEDRREVEGWAGELAAARRRRRPAGGASGYGDGFTVTSTPKPKPELSLQR
jgi:hypothetical protein